MFKINIKKNWEKYYVIKNHSKVLSNNLVADSIPQLHDSLTGRVIKSGDAEYDEARTVFYGGKGYPPAHLFHVAEVDDVLRGIPIPVATGLETALPRGGH